MRTLYKHRSTPDTGIHTYIETHKHRHTHTITYRQRHIHRNTLKQAHTHTHIHVQTHIETHTQTLIDTQTCTQTHIYTNTQSVYHFVLTHRKTLVWCFSFAFVFPFNFFYSGSIECFARLCLGDSNEYTKLNLSHHGAEYLGQFVVKTDNVDWEGSSMGRSTCYVKIRT